MAISTPGSSRPPLFTFGFTLLLLVQLLYGIALATFFVLPRYLIEVLHAPPLLVGNAQGAFALGGVAVVPVLGLWIDKKGSKPVMLLGALLGAVTFALFCFATTPFTILGLRALHGVSFSMVFTAGSVVVLELAPAARRAEAVGYFGTAMLMTNAVGPAAAEYLVSVASWNAVFLMCALCSAGALLPGALLTSAKVSDNSSVTVKLPLSRRLAAVYLACFAMGVGVGTSKTFVPAILVSEGRNVVAPFFIAYTVGALFQRSVFGWLPDRIGRARVTVAALLVYGVGLALVVPASVDHISWLGVIIGIAHGAAYPASAALGAESCAVSQRGRVTAWSTGFFNLGIAIANSAVVLLEGPLGYRGLMAVGAGILWFISGLVRWLVGGDRSRSVAE